MRCMTELIDENLSFSEKAINSSDKNAILPVVAIIFCCIHGLIAGPEVPGIVF